MFGPTNPAPIDSGTISAAPVRAPGTRARSGNAMARTRARLLDAALRAVQQRGPARTTMADVAGFAGVAKATLYNHFRTKNDVWSALVTSQVEAIARECSGLPLATALEQAAVALSVHPALRRLAVDDPAAMAALVTGSD
ncbi:MAG: TetR family transcriptional regulator, partial [Mycobacteriales bacterium]